MGDGSQAEQVPVTVTRIGAVAVTIGGVGGCFGGGWAAGEVDRGWGRARGA
jgi:hypothetical protein